MKDLFNKDKWKYLWYTVSHPNEGYYWIRHQERGSVAIAILLVLVFSLCFSMNRIYASFVVNDINPRTVNSLTELLGVVMMFFIIVFVFTEFREDRFEVVVAPHLVPGEVHILLRLEIIADIHSLR